jgi:hypothetical protein
MSFNCRLPADLDSLSRQADTAIDIGIPAQIDKFEIFILKSSQKVQIIWV